MSPTVALLASYIFVMILSWYPASIHDFTGTPRNETLSRYWSISADLAMVATDDGTKPLPMKCSDACKRVLTALIVASFAGYESGGFRKDVDENVDVSVDGLGDNGHAYCLMQLHMPFAKGVTDRRSCFRQGLVAMHESRRMCNGSLNAYATGTCEDSKGVVERYVKRAQTYYDSHPYPYQP